jgi:hypothetical protein
MFQILPKFRIPESMIYVSQCVYVRNNEMSWWQVTVHWIMTGVCFDQSNTLLIEATTKIEPKIYNRICDVLRQNPKWCWAWANQNKEKNAFPWSVLIYVFWVPLSTLYMYGAPAKQYLPRRLLIPWWRMCDTFLLAETSTLHGCNEECILIV